ncbi:MAG: hypothetical protein AAGI08_03995 [Bacteroidota bacterium]
MITHRAPDWYPRDAGDANHLQAGCIRMRVAQVFFESCRSNAHPMLARLAFGWHHGPKTYSPRSRSTIAGHPQLAHP